MKFLPWAIIGILLIITYSGNNKKGSEDLQETYSSVQLYKNQVDSLDTVLQKYKDTLRKLRLEIRYSYQRSHYITDEEIRAIRRADPNHIYKFPGRRVYSEQEEFERRAEEYIEDNEEEILDRLRD